MVAEALTLEDRIRAELTRAAPAEALRLAAAIVERVGPSAAAVLFYGSCLRQQTASGVFDFYVLVDDYRSASPSALLGLLAAALPPNVFYLECPAPGGETLRAKYALLSRADFQSAARGDWLRTGIWARFCQPTLAPWLREPALLEEISAACAESLRTALRTIAPLLAETFTPLELWQRIFAETYASEMRAERADTIATLLDSAPERYAVLTRDAARSVGAHADLPFEVGASELRLRLSAPRRAGLQRAWWRQRRWAKLAYVLQLLKTAFTFGDWLPYALWKLERHSGVRLEASERQRRRPLIFGWPLLLRALRLRALR